MSDDALSFPATNGAWLLRGAWAFRPAFGIACALGALVTVPATVRRTMEAAQAQVAKNPGMMIDPSAGAKLATVVLVAKFASILMILWYLVALVRVTRAPISGYRLTEHALVVERHGAPAMTVPWSEVKSVKRLPGIVMTHGGRHLIPGLSPLIPGLGERADTSVGPFIMAASWESEFLSIVCSGSRPPVLIGLVPGLDTALTAGGLTVVQDGAYGEWRTRFMTRLAWQGFLLLLLLIGVVPALT